MPYLVDPVLPPGAWSSQQQPVLSSDSRTLRPWMAEDAPSLVEAYDDPAIQQWHCRTMTLPEAEEWIRAKAEGWGRESAVDAGLHRIDGWHDMHVHGLVRQRQGAPAPAP